MDNIEMFRLCGDSCASACITLDGAASMQLVCSVLMVGWDSGVPTSALAHEYAHCAVLNFLAG
jgi:hypothetical protein